MDNSNHGCDPATHNPEIIQLDFGFEVRRHKTIKKNKDDDFVLDIIDLISAPIISFPSQWMGSLPKELIKDIPMARFLSVFDKEFKATFAEVVAYLMPRTLDAPMSHDWTEIYFWAGFQYLNVFGTENAKRDLREMGINGLNSYQHKLLDDLRLWLYKKRREVIKARLKADKKNDVINGLQSNITLFNQK